MAFILFRKSSRLGSDPSGFADAGDGAEGIDAYPNHQPLKSLERGNIFVATADMGVTVQSRWMMDSSALAEVVSPAGFAPRCKSLAQTRG